MKRSTEFAPVKPMLSRSEAKSDATAKAARAIIDKEAAARAIKMKRLRASRLAREDVDKLLSALK
jgi:hypothetical protein